MHISRSFSSPYAFEPTHVSTRPIHHVHRTYPSYSRVGLFSWWYPSSWYMYGAPGWAPAFGGFIAIGVGVLAIIFIFALIDAFTWGYYSMPSENILSIVMDMITKT